MVLLQGRLEVLVIEARGLPNLDSNVLTASDKSDPYCVVSVEGINGSKRIGKTFTIDDCLNPKWNFKMVLDLHTDVSRLKFTVKDKDPFGSETIGTCYLDALLFTSVAMKNYRGLLHLTNSKGRPAGTLRVQVSFSGSGNTGQNAESGIVDRIRGAADDMKSRLIYSSPKQIEYDPKSKMFLHGALQIFVHKAIDLPNFDTTILSFRKKDVSDPYVTILLEDGSKESWRVGTTSVIDNDLNPVWKQHFNVSVCHGISAVKFVVRDKDVVSAEEMGSFSIRGTDIKPLQEISGEFDLHVKSKHKKSKLVLSLKYIPVEDLVSSLEVPECLFPLREMNRVTLYQDAHCLKYPVPLVTFHTPRRAWLDLYETVIEAKEFIYIVGWSVNTKIALLRWDGEDTRCIGDILIQKANEGVHVCVMVWNELTSTELNKSGTMGTNDEETAEFFKNTAVTVILASRERGSTDVLSTKEHFTNFCYTHHQKCVVADAPTEDGSDQRQIVAYVGGLDLTNGRFDTPEHPLFSTLHSDHKHDFYNSLLETTRKYGPREPWHDIHCRIEGSAALDLFSNFKERWNKQGSKKNKKRSLVNPDGKFNYNIKSHDQWGVQLFRSINSDSASFPHSTILSGLYIKKARLFDNSIQRAYIHNIRRSQKFLYMENQYFMGSSHEWVECKEAQIQNLIPLEIAIHIEKKIRAGERYTAYILIPMYPEGKAADKVVQEILHWQFRTMEMMYLRVAEAISEAKIDAHPQDFLMFFCLGKKEGRNPQPVPPELVGQAGNAYKNRRLMIYVHSKMAIFDDEYIIVGSANVNDRSMSGNRDTEIAIGAFQQEYKVQGSYLPDGSVATFRKSLWAEHIGADAPIGLDPSSLTCARKVRQLAEDGLLSFINNGEEPGIRHLMIYPLKVHKNGSVSEREDCPTFPDTVAKVTGGRSGYIPTRLTS